MTHAFDRKYKENPGIFLRKKNDEKEKSFAFFAAVSEFWMFREVNPNFSAPQNNI